MLMFGHPGVTLGTALLLSGILQRNRSPAGGEVATRPDDGESLTGVDSWLSALGRRVDIRLLLIGSLLPDIVDKPLGQVFLRYISNGRIFAHTLLFVLVLTVSGLWLYRRRRSTGLLALAFGSLMHIIEDQMWWNLPTLLWPLYGFSFVQLDLGQWIPEMLYALLTNPAVYVPELAGAVVLGWFAWQLWHRKKVYAFITKGRV